MGDYINIILGFDWIFCQFRLEFFGKQVEKFQTVNLQVSFAINVYCFLLLSKNILLSPSKIILFSHKATVNYVMWATGWTYTGFVWGFWMQKPYSIVEACFMAHKNYCKRWQCPQMLQTLFQKYKRWCWWCHNVIRAMTPILPFFQLVLTSMQIDCILLCSLDWQHCNLFSLIIQVEWLYGTYDYAHSPQSVPGNMNPI